MRSPWTKVAPIEPDRTYIASATHLRVARLGVTGRAFRGAGATTAQLRQTPGVLGFATWVQPLRRNYWTLTLWQDESGIAAFLQAGDHREVMRELASELVSSTSVRWSHGGEAGKPDWRRASAELAAKGSLAPRG